MHSHSHLDVLRSLLLLVSVSDWLLWLSSGTSTVSLPQDKDKMVYVTENSSVISSFNSSFVVVVYFQFPYVQHLGVVYSALLCMYYILVLQNQGHVLLLQHTMVVIMQCSFVSFYILYYL